MQFVLSMWIEKKFFFLYYILVIPYNFMFFFPKCVESSWNARKMKIAKDINVARERKPKWRRDFEYIRIIW